MSEIAFTWIGYVCVLLICLAIFAFAAGWALSEAKELYSRHRYQLENSGRRELGARMLSDRYWLSQHPKVMAMWQFIGESIANNGTYCINKARDVLEEEGNKG